MSLKHGDLRGTIEPKISIDEFKPKAGNDNNVIVVAFYLKEKDPADDLNTFIQRGSIDTLDVEVSPNTDELGRYLVFVEMSRNSTFVEKFTALVKDIENVSGKQDWYVVTYYSGGREFRYTDPMLFNYLVLDPAQYVSKDEFMTKDLEESVKTFMNNSLVTSLHYAGGSVILSNSSAKVIAEVVDIGDYDTVIGRNFLSESHYLMGALPYESRVLSSITGYTVLPLDKYLVVQNGDCVMLLKNTQIA